MIDELENDPRVEKYAWFMNRNNSGSLEQCGALYDDNGITEVGKTYRDTFFGAGTFKSFERDAVALVFQKTYEEVQCEGTLCNFKVTADLPIVSSLTELYENDDWYLKITGTAFTSSAEFFVDGKKQEVVSTDESNLIVKIVDVNSSYLQNIRLFFDIGTPHNHSAVFRNGL